MSRHGWLWLAVAPLLLIGCTTPIKLAVPPAQEVIIEPGKLTIDGKVTSEPYDCYYKFADGKLTPYASGFKLEPLIGVDLVGLEGSPWCGLRFFHVENVGASFGFDRYNFTCGINYLYHDIALGPGVAFPYDLSPSKFCIMAGFLF